MPQTAPWKIGSRNGVISKLALDELADIVTSAWFSSGSLLLSADRAPSSLRISAKRSRSGRRCISSSESTPTGLDRLEGVQVTVAEVLEAGGFDVQHDRRLRLGRGALRTPRPDVDAIDLAVLPRDQVADVVEDREHRRAILSRRILEPAAWGTRATGVTTASRSDRAVRFSVCSCGLDCRSDEPQEGRKRSPKALRTAHRSQALRKAARSVREEARPRPRAARSCAREAYTYCPSLGVIGWCRER
jgi:hypothetical protein